MRKNHAHNQSPGQGVSDAVGFLVEQCFQMITHDCECPNCTMQKGRAIKALMYIFGEKFGIEEAKTMFGGGEFSGWGFGVGQETRQAEEADFDPIPDEVIHICQEALKSKRDENFKAIIAGWLESVGA